MAGLLIGDIGGTNARFAVADNGRYGRLSHVEVARFPSLHDALIAYLDGLPAASRPNSGALAIAGPVFGDRVALTNHGWSFSIAELKRGLGFASLDVVNDFAATAMSVPYLPQADVFGIGPDVPATAGPIAIIGPGTGLGVSTLVPNTTRSKSNSWLLVPGEGGHVTLPATSQQEADIIGVLRARWGHVSAERALSGAGLVNLHDALCTLAGRTPPAMTPAEVTDHAIRNTDATCVAAFGHFCAMLGTVAGDLALTTGATGGVYIAGGILLRFKKAFAASDFRRRFEDKGRFGDFLRGIPTRLILEESPALVGLTNFGR